MATFLERTAHLIVCVFSLHFVFMFLQISRLGFEDRILVLIVQVPGHYLLFTSL